MIGNILIHVLGMGIDVYDYLSHFIKISGVVMGAVVHLGLGGGFAYYLSRLPKGTA